MKSKTHFLNVSENARMTMLASLIVVGAIASQFNGEQGSLAHWGPTLDKAFDSVIGADEPKPAECSNNVQKHCAHP